MTSPNLGEIRLLEVRVPTTSASSEMESIETHRTVLEKVEDYLLTHQCSTPHTQGILLQLLTVGKVRADFRDFSERLQLLEKDQRMSREQAIQVLEDSFAAVLRDPQEGEAPDLTQKIIIQPPKGGGYLGAS
jgi:hypothetical protein